MKRCRACIVGATPGLTKWVCCTGINCCKWSIVSSLPNNCEGHTEWNHELETKTKIIIRQLDAVQEVATHIQTNILQNFCKTQILFPVITILGHREWNHELKQIRQLNAVSCNSHSDTLMFKLPDP